ncbi:uncharacterized protein PV09_00518 [Verruconis gallopava]|uniref:BTB domain-containing protein n=1 Tax=Verruconis gallopava TaxID=253628 RepID=A0A0D2APY9_9PEZI|nr:uncharacterized protein PV09_00518 [Verruconis gallopava]KIW08550.1 hypothetical protein PV09_00518 [Verruconis gallopava]
MASFGQYHDQNLASRNPFASHPSSLSSTFQPPPLPPSNAPSPSSASSSSSANNTFVMPAPSARSKKPAGDSYKPKIITTVGARPACLVNASVTYVGNNQIYAFGGFDQYTDEVYNHVLRLDLTTKQWSLVDNYGDIPGVRMGHTANLWQGDKILVYGGENEHRAYLSDVIIFDLKTAHWTQPELHGPPPRGRARHASVIHDEKLYIMGGMAGNESYVLDDICYLDLKTWTWSKTWRFVPRYDHTAWIWDGRIWAFGGLGEDMERTSEIWWIDLRGNTTNAFERKRPQARLATGTERSGLPNTGTSGYAANTSSLTTASHSMHRQANTPHAPGSISSLKFLSSPNLPPQAVGSHFHMFSSGCLLDFLTPATVLSSLETSLSALDLDTLRWQKLADGKDLFHPGYRWHYCAMDEDGTHAWLLGCPSESATDNSDLASEAYLSDVLPIDLRKLGVLGNRLSSEVRRNGFSTPASDMTRESSLLGIGADLVQLFDQPPEAGGSADFTVTGELDDDDEASQNVSDADGSTTLRPTSKPIHVHRLILQARWAHFNRMYNAQMREFHTRNLHIPEPYSVVRAFLFYLYTDSIYDSRVTLTDVAGLLVMADLYDMPRLRVLCVNRLGKELDVEHAAIIWERAGTAGEDWLRKKAATFCMNNWGRVVRSKSFKNLRHTSLLELCEEVDIDSRILSGDEVERLSGGLGGLGGRGAVRKGSIGLSLAEEETGEEDDADDGMDVS